MAASRVYVIPVFRRYWLYAVGPSESTTEHAVLRWQEGAGLEEKIERMGQQLSSWVGPDRLYLVSKRPCRGLC